MENLFDRDLIIRRRLRALRMRQDSCDFLMRRACEELSDRLTFVDLRFENAVSLFCCGDQPARALHKCGKVEQLARIEMDAELLGSDKGIVERREVVPVPRENADLIVSLLALHEINDLPGLLTQIRRSLRPDGLFLAAIPGGGTLSELRECLLAAETELTGGAASRVYPFIDVRDAGALLQRAGYALPVVDVETATVRYDSAIDLMHDLRAMGATSSLKERSRKPLRRHVVQRCCELYESRFADSDGRIRATFNTIWISGWAPHESQQKPLKPGSAKTGLERALREIEKREPDRPNK